MKTKAKIISVLFLLLLLAPTAQGQQPVIYNPPPNLGRIQDNPCSKEALRASLAESDRAAQQLRSETLALLVKQLQARLDSLRVELDQRNVQVETDQEKITSALREAATSQRISDSLRLDIKLRDLKIGLLTEERDHARQWTVSLWRVFGIVKK